MRPLVAATIAAFVSACGSTAPDGSASQVAPRYTLTIALGGSGSGNVRSTDGAIDCPASRCAATTQAGTRYTLVAAAAPGSHFSGWGNACSRNVACDVLLSGDQTVSASFDKDRSTGTTHELQVSVNGAGTVTSQPGGIDCARSCAASFDAAATVALTAVPTSGFIFAGWGGACSGAGPCAVSMDVDRQVWATFQATPPKDECANLRFSPPGAAPGRHEIGQVHSGLCLAGLSDGHGTLALQAWSGKDNDFTVHFLGPGGELRKAYPQADLILTEQLAGFEGMSLERVDPDSYTLGWMLRTYDMDGQQLAQIPTKLADHLIIHADPLGGMMTQNLASPAELRSYDEQLQLRWHVSLSAGDPWGSYGSAVDRAGNTLVLFVGDMFAAPNTVDAMWIDHDGRVGPKFRVAGPFPTFPSQVLLTQRVGSGLFVRIDSQWKGQIESRSTSAMSPAPTWLEARPGTTLHMVRNGRGYAVLPEATEFCPPMVVEIFAPTGAACGTATFQPSASSSRSCKFDKVSIGYDGTVMLSYGMDSSQCVWEWWPGVLG